MSLFGKYVKNLSKKDEIRARKYTGKVSTEIFNPEKEFTLVDTVEIKKKSEKDFVILNLSDVHFTDYNDFMEISPKRSLFTPLTVKRLVKKLKPDLITVTGDIVCGSSTVFSIERFINLMESFSVAWAPVFGNHDKEGNCDLNYLAERMMSAPHCLMKKGDPEMGVGNYIVSVTDDDGELIEALFMMDSQHSKQGEKNAQPNEKQHEWVKWASDGIRKISPKAEISLFMHIPIPEYVFGYENAFDKEAEEWRDCKKSVGHVGEEIACHMTQDGKPIQKGFFSLIKNAGNIKNIFSGHDHLNAFSLEYEGIRLNYVMKISKSAGRKFGYDGGLKIVCGESGIKALDFKTVSYILMTSAYKLNF